MRLKSATREPGPPFGPNIQALAIYLKHVQHVSYHRLQSMFADVFGLTIGQGALGDIFGRAQVAFHGKNASTLARLRTADPMASEETGVRIEVVNAPRCAFGAPGLMLDETAFNRAAQVVRIAMIGCRPAFWTSDRDIAQKEHGERCKTCLAHLARDIAFALEVKAGS